MNNFEYGVTEFFGLDHQKNSLRNQLNSDVEQFLKDGGHIDTLGNTLQEYNGLNPINIINLGGYIDF